MILPGVGRALGWSRGSSAVCYHQRGPLEHTFFGPFGGSFSAVSKPNFASKYSLESSWRDLHFFLCTIPDFCDFSRLLHHFCKIRRKFSWVSKETADLAIFRQTSADFFGISQHNNDFSDFDRNDAKIVIIFQRKFLKCWKLAEHFVKICLKKRIILCSKSLRW